MARIRHDRSRRRGAGLRASRPGRARGEALGLSRPAGRRLLLPEGRHPGCTTQACGVRDHRADYAKVGAVVLGISPDPVKKVKKFHDKYDLDFRCWPTRATRWPRLWRVGREVDVRENVLGNERTTFVIDSDGKVAEVLRKVKPASTMRWCWPRWRRRARRWHRSDRGRGSAARPSGSESPYA